MTPTLGLTIAGFVFAMMVQFSIASYYYGRLTMHVELLKEKVGTLAGKDQVEQLKSEVATHASKEQVKNVESEVDKLSTLFEQFLVNIDLKLDKVQEQDHRDDARVLKAMSHLETYVGEVASWIGDRLGTVSTTLVEHDRLLRKTMKASQVSDDRIPAQSAASISSHQIIPPVPKPTKHHDTRREE